jgi:EAL domain-containing protein (putative c-di-GMP-specific phosphodiesterase class I)
LSLKIVAEGVTTQAQLKFLQGEGCDAIQGFRMSPAIAADAFVELLRLAPSAVIRDALSPMRQAG